MGAMLDVELPARPQLRGIVEAVAAATWPRADAAG